jgi:hypothetical protein
MRKHNVHVRGMAEGGDDENAGATDAASSN